jgi:hypothetical protein
VSIGDVTSLGDVEDIVSCQLLMKLLAVDMVLGWNGWNRITDTESIIYIQRVEEVRGMGYS